MILGRLPRTLGACLVLMTAPLYAGEGEGESSITDYWYGGELHPLVVTRDGVNYLLIGKQVVEMPGASGPTRTYAHADHLGSVRVVTDDGGNIVESLGYDDYGATHIAGQSAAASFDSVASFYRFQGQEQETFPLVKLGIADDALAQWLDRIELYHFPWRDYAAGLAAFSQTDPVPTEDSLYAALGADPVNFTDETGGMIEESKYDDDDENEQAQVQDLLRRFADNPEMRFTPKEHELLGKAYLEGRNVIVEEIKTYNALRFEISTWKRRTRRAADAAETQEERDVLSMDLYYFRKFHLEVISKWKIAQQKLVKFDEQNASLREAWNWSVLSLVLSNDANESDDDDVFTEVLQSMAISPSPEPSAQAAAVAAPENSTVLHSQAMDAEEKTEEANEEHNAKGHESHEQMKNLEDGSS
jgi:RHS repeat-associated protein